MADVPDAKKAAALGKMSYRDFLVKHAGLPDEAARLYQRYTAPYFGVGTDAAPADNCLAFGLPGLRGLGRVWSSSGGRDVELSAGHRGRLLPRTATRRFPGCWFAN